MTALGFVAGTCRTAYVARTNVSASPVATICSGFSASNYTPVYVNGGITIDRKPLSISGSTVASKQYNGDASPGIVTPGSLSGLVSGETLIVSVSPTNVTDYASAIPGTYTTTVTYTLADSTGLAGNYKLSPENLSGSITETPIGFTLAINTDIASKFNTTFNSQQNPVRLDATINPYAAGTVAFAYSSNAGSTWTNINCVGVVGAVTVQNNGVATCEFVPPVTGAITLRASYTPNSVTNQSQSATLNTTIVPRPVITSYTLSTGATAARVGSQIVINGSNFLGVNQITFTSSTGTVAANPATIRATATRIVVTVPTGAITGAVVVTTQFGGPSISNPSVTVGP